MSAPGSPQTPRHSRNLSTQDDLQPPMSDRRESKSSFQDVPMHSLSSLSHQDTLDLNIVSSGGAGGIGNLADELADAFSDSGEEEDDGNDCFPASVIEDGAEPDARPARTSDPVTLELPPSSEGGCLPVPNRHQRKASEYDGSEYGSESDLDSTGLPASVIAKIDAVESLVRRGTENFGGPEFDVFKRVTDGLRDLGSQSSVEGGASRLITTHSALATHLAHQTRQIQSLTFPLLSPFSPPPDPDTIDIVVPLLVGLSDNMPKPSTVAFNSLASLHSMTAELIQTLSYLSDTLHMSRQTTIMATRRLKSAKELVAEMRRDEELREEGERWLTRGNWGDRLQRRECAGVCGEVIGGFEDVCNGWRERLLAQEETRA